VAAAAAIYPFEMCKSILEGLVEEMKARGRWDSAAKLVLPPSHAAEVKSDTDPRGEEENGEHIRVAVMLAEKGDEAVFVDDITGQILDTKLVRRARQVEMVYFDEKKVYTKVPIQEAWDQTGKNPIGVRWVDVNKADDECPNYRSRLVAKDFKRKGEDSIFAPTPPLEAIRTVLMMATTIGLWAPEWVSMKGEHRVQISFIDISRAYFHALVDQKRPLFVHLPAEDEDFGKELCGRLNVHMYGTRPAAEGWYSEYSGSMEEFGFKTGTSSGCVFFHPELYLVSAVHGDDFTTCGPRSSLDKLGAFLRTKYELKEAARLGPAPEDSKETRVLNRVVRWTEEGVEYEGDPRQSEKFDRRVGSSRRKRRMHSSRQSVHRGNKG
jgi:hypothetical protein